MVDPGQLIQAFVVAAGLGAVIGLERQAHDDPHDRHAGARTFALYAVWGAGTAWIAERYGELTFALGLVGFSALIVASFAWHSHQSQDTGTTTEAAAFIAFLIGVLSWSEQYVVATALAIGVAALLRAKEPLHRLTDRFSDADVRAALQFGVLTAVILPLVPEEGFGPYDAIDLAGIWRMVVLVSGVGFAGYVALRAMGHRGLGPTGLIGGLISSTAVTLGFSRMSRVQPNLRSALVAGILAAGGLMYARVLFWAYLKTPDLGNRLVVPLGILTVVVLGAGFIWWRRPVEQGEAEGGLEVGNPLTLTTALTFGVLYGVIVFLSTVLIENVSPNALNLVGLVSGINDVDAITLAMGDFVRAERIGAGQGAQVVVAAVTVNTAVKAGMALAIGSRRLGRNVAMVLGTAAVAGGAVWPFL